MKISNEYSRKRANTYFFRKILLNLVMIILGTVLITYCLIWIQKRTSYARQEENSRITLDEAVSALEQNEADAKLLTQIFHKENQDVAYNTGLILSNGLFQYLEGADPKEKAEVFKDLAERSGANYLLLLSKDCKTVYASDSSLIGFNPAALSFMTQENINRLMEGTSSGGVITPVLVKNQNGTFYFYSRRYTYMHRVFTIAVGREAAMLDSQISSLTDVSVELNRSAVSNNGFLFAVDKTDGTFLYYVDGDDILSGQSAAEFGLSENALQDGYAGFETIRGKRYYCVSKAFGEDVTICAVAQTKEILAGNRSALFWTILGFIIIMLLCLVFAIIVRNDFVRRAVPTEKITINPKSRNPLFFDKTLFRKIFPLMILGFITIWCASFYTQTLLEITQCIDRSELVLGEIIGRYEENTTSAEVIHDYYSDIYFSKARLIASMLEEDPSVLNAATDYYYSTYDETGSKQFVPDAEGNPLRSVPSSQKYQRICDANSIEAIYVFDEEGHTIATNTPDWFFTISADEEDASYGFWDILREKTDSRNLEMAIGSANEPQQYIGVAFRYYTTKNEAGETVYVSRLEYENARKKQQDAQRIQTFTTYDGITPHRSLILIAPDSSLTRNLLRTANADDILMSRELAGSSILLFDTSEEHRCLYSPNEANIGKTAEDLGISPNAFGDGDYYGFCRINGTSCFQVSRYSQGYYISLLLPISGMYRSRMPISMVTAFISFLLIIILSGTVTITNQEEENLYESMSSEEAAKGLDSAIFNLILPSGKNISTVNAAARWDNRRISWFERTPEQKLGMITLVISVLLLIYLCFSISLPQRMQAEGPIIRYILKGNWDRGFNIFALTACVLVIILAAIIFFLFRIPVRLFSSLLGARGETIGHLLLSVLRYGGVFAAFFYCLYLLGIDSSSLLASAGILTLVIGLGAQSLINNIISGIFIIFEGEFRIGDIVTISGYRGTVMDIGLRTTKIMSADGNIKIFNNSEISGILNMTKEASLATCRISIEYGQDIRYVEAVLKRDLPKLRENNPLILDGPEYVGVAELGDSGVTLLIICKCQEKDIMGVIRYLNEKVLQIFYDNDINVPFPNITLSNLADSNRKTIDDFHDDEVDDGDGGENIDKIVDDEDDVNVNNEAKE